MIHNLKYGNMQEEMYCFPFCDFLNVTLLSKLQHTCYNKWTLIF